MNEKKVIIPVAVAKALLVSAANNDIRYYLNGINIVVRDGECTLASTDGHRLSYCAVQHEGFDSDEVINDIIPSSVFKMLVKNKEYLKSISHDKNIVLTKSDAHWFVTANDFELGINLIDGKYPDWRRAIPGDIALLDCESVFNTKYLIDLQKIGEILGAKLVGIKLNGANKAASTNFSGDGFDFSVVVMPMLT